ncbi:MAG: alpha/beta fold hydrolase [Pseudomonadota bacterium]
MIRIELKMPRLGETMEEGRIAAWMVGPGETFARGDVLLEVETDKTLVDAPALAEGKMLKQLAAEGDDVPVGAAIAIIEVPQEAVDAFAVRPAEGAGPGAKAAPATADGADEALGKDAAPKGAAVGDAAPASPPPSADTHEGATPPPGDAPPAPRTGDAPPTPPTVGDAPDPALAALRATFPGLKASPAARAAAQELGVPMAGLRGTGRGGRVTALDVHAAAARAGAAPGPAASGGSSALHAVLIHGLFSDPDEMAPLAKALRECGALSAEALPLPAHGGAPALDDPSPAAAGAALAAQLQDRRDIALVGHSFGAAAAVHAAEALGARVARLTLLCPLGLGAEIAEPLLRSLLEARTPEAAARGAQALAGEGAQPLSPAAAATLAARLNGARMALSAMLRASVDGGVQQVWIGERLARLSAPATLVFGRDDPVFPVSQALAAPPNAAVRLLPAVGHMPHLRSPHATARLALGLEP